MLALGALLLVACAEARERRSPPPVYEDDVGALLKERCAGCHGERDAGGGYRLDGYLETLSCPTDAPARSAVTRGDAGIPLLDVLARDDHASLLDDTEQARVAAWIARDVPLRDHGVHEPSALDPRSPNWHGRLAAADRFARLIDAEHPEACGRCHAGTPVTPRGIEHPERCDSCHSSEPVKPPGIEHAADAAPACTTCHQEPAGVLACGTCHGDGAARADPPRDACWFSPARADAHAAHVRGGALRAAVLECSACHPRADATLSGMHADGVVDVRLDPALAGEAASFDQQSGRCAVSCHDHGGARTQPRWHEPGPMRCGDCHGAPPAEHFAGACDGCHADVDPDGRALSSTAHHLDGRVDVGPRDAAGRGCAACHGRGTDPLPDDAPHALHRAPRVTAEISCSECHALPDSITDPGHLDLAERDAADVTFGPLARARGRLPSYDPDTRTCKDVACHGAGLVDGVERALAWDERTTGACGTCHGLPPRSPHPQQSSCAAIGCHGTEVTAGSLPAITELGRALHVNGEIDRGSP